MPTAVITESRENTMSSSRIWMTSGDDLVVSHRPITFDQEAIILGIEDCLINVIARERPDAVRRIPERERDDLRSIAVIATQHPGPLIARC
jgi:hypothetical protein